MMSEATITEASLQAAITERLKAIHVQVTDMSGTIMSYPVSFHTRPSGPSADS